MFRWAFNLCIHVITLLTKITEGEKDNPGRHIRSGIVFPQVRVERVLYYVQLLKKNSFWSISRTKFVPYVRLLWSVEIKLETQFYRTEESHSKLSVPEEISWIWRRKEYSLHNNYAKLTKYGKTDTLWGGEGNKTIVEKQQRIKTQTQISQGWW